MQHKLVVLYNLLMLEGKITNINEKGFGFMKVDGKDVFFHAKAVQGKKFDELTKGMDVTVPEVHTGDRGLYATEVNAA